MSEERKIKHFNYLHHENVIIISNFVYKRKIKEGTVNDLRCKKKKKTESLTKNPICEGIIMETEKKYHYKEIKNSL
jgi:hypothetical protein